MGSVIAYRVKAKKLNGSSYHEVYKRAFQIYSDIKKGSKRRPYIKSKYFRNDKIFIAPFWQHLYDKLNHKDKSRRLKYYPCAIELIRHSCLNPTSKENSARKDEILHRFAGITAEREIFFVQIKENKRNGQKYSISIFPLFK